MGDHPNHVAPPSRGRADAAAITLVGDLGAGRGLSDSRRNRSSGGSWQRIRRTSDQAPGLLLPFAPAVGTWARKDGDFDHLGQMCGLAEIGQQGEEVLNDAGPAEPGEPLSRSAPTTELARHSTLDDMLDGEIVQRIQEQPVRQTPSDPASRTALSGETLSVHPASPRNPRPPFPWTSPTSKQAGPS